MGRATVEYVAHSLENNVLTPILLFFMYFFPNQCNKFSDEWLADVYQQTASRRSTLCIFVVQHTIYVYRSLFYDYTLPMDLMTDTWNEVYTRASHFALLYIIPACTIFHFDFLRHLSHVNVLHRLSCHCLLRFNKTIYTWHKKTSHRGKNTEREKQS